MVRCNVHIVNALLLCGSLITGCDSAEAVTPRTAESAIASGVSSLVAGLHLGIGETYQIPGGPASFRDLRKIGPVASYRSLDTNVASVSGNGVVVGRASGGTLILQSNSGVGIDTLPVSVGSGPLPLRFDIDTLRLLQIGATQVVLPTENRYRPQATSANSSVVLVLGAGMVRAVSPGTTAIDFIDLTGSRGRLPVRVSTSVLRFPIDSLVLLAGQSATVAATGSLSTVQYRSSNSSVATVDNAGMVRGVAAGNAMIVATASDASPDTLWIAVESSSKTSEEVVINASIVRREQGSGTIIVSTAAPLPPGLLMPGSANRVRVKIAGVEQSIATQELNGRHPDGSLHSVLIQFPYSLPFGSPVPAQIVIGTTPRTTPLAVISSSVDRGNPAAVMLPTDPVYLVTTDLVGPTATAAETQLRFGALGKRYDTDFAKYSDILYRSNGDNWVEDYYDRAQAYYAMWVRTGNSEYWERGTRLVLNYRKDYLEQNNYGTSPHWSQVDGIGLHYLLTGDDQSRVAIKRVTETLSYFRVRLGLGLKTHASIENRIRARVLMAQLWYWRLADEPVAAIGKELEEAYTAVLGAQEADGSYRFTPYCNQSLNYMDGMLNEALIQIYLHFRRDSRIVTAVEKNVEWMWTQWVPSAQGFQYVPAICEGVGGINAVPELNGLIINGYAWIYSLKKSPTVAARADAIFKGSVEKSFLTGSKQFNQHYSTSWRYFAWR